MLLASVLPRAIETAQIIAPGLGLEIAGHDCDLCEVHTGEADGLAWEEYTTRYGSFDMEAEPDRVFAPEGESWNSFHERVQRLLERLAADHPDETVVAVCHAGVIMASMRGLLGIPHAGRRHAAAAHQHRAHRVGARPRARPLDPALLQRDRPPPRPRRHGVSRRPAQPSDGEGRAA